MGSTYDTYVGFDSAWTDNPKAPGAIAAMSVQVGQPVQFFPPRLASFSDALDFIRDVRSPFGCTLIALDQPTVVPNQTSMRPVERLAASLISWLGGGVQPSNRRKTGMFCDASPIWRFLAEVGAKEAPEEARTATSGLYLMEVFPALALPSLDPQFFGRLAAPKYNPGQRRTFRPKDWERVTLMASTQFDRLGLAQAAEWCRETSVFPQPRKADQDRLDAMICLLIALHWRLRPRSESLMLGSLHEGYMVLPASPDVRHRLLSAAERTGVSAR